MIWKILEIDKTKDEEVIRSAYREKLRYVNPEDDEEGFKELRRAYEEALEYASRPEDEDLNDADESEYGYGKKDEVDEWLKRIDMIYQDVVKRRDESMWEPVLHDPVCDDLDMELEAAEKLLVYFMSHSYMPQSIWQLVDKRFHYMDNYDQLKEKFPENYLDYVMWQMKRPNFIDFHLFDGVTDSHVDDYIGTLYEEKNAFEEGNMEAVERFLKELKRYDVTHPYTETEEARYLLYRAQTQKKKAENSTDVEGHLSEKRDEQVPDWKEDVKKALSIMEELDFEYSDNPYIERIYAEALLANGEVQKARSVYEGLTEADPENYSARLGIARCVYLEGNPEDAKELVEDILEERVQDVECMQLLDEINEELVKTYESALSEKEDMIPEQDSKEEKDGETVRELSFKLGWCYYQQKEFEKGIQLLDGLDEGEDYDYINLRCRLYLANENYEAAYPLTKKWLQLIEEAVDDGSKEVQKKKNRLSLAHFSIGICLWELNFKEKEELLLRESKKEQVSGIDDKISDLERELERAAEYIEKAIEEEQNTLVKLSYMEQLARFYLAQKQYEKCIDICDDIITKDRGFYPAYVHRQRANYELKNAKEVIDDYFACKEIYPGYSVPYVLAAEVFMAFEQYDDVESVIKEGEEAGFQSDGLEFYKIKCLHYKNFSVENVRKAIDQLDLLMERIRIRPEEEGSDIEDLSDLNREMAILYWDLDLTSKALEIVDKYLDEHPDTSGMLQLKVDILSREKRYEEALAACRLLVKTNPKNLHYRIKLGNCYEWMEDTGKAIECYRMILMENRDFVPAVRRLMYVYSYLSNENRDLELCKKGIEYANQLIEITGNAEGYVERGNLYIDLYELEKAVEDCKEAVKLDPEAYYAYNNMGCALLKLRRIDEAIEPLEKAIAMDPDKDHLPYLNLAECYVIKKDYEKAIHAYEEILRIRPKAMRMREEIAKIWIKMGQYLKAVDFYKSLIKESQKRLGIVWDSMVIKILLKQEGQQEECERLLKYYAELADIYRQMGDKDNAEKWYKNIEKVYFKRKEPCSISHAETVAEYYRDKGDIKEAERVLAKLLDYMEKNNISRYHVYFTLTTVMFEKGDRERAKKYADAFIKGLLKQHGGEEAMLSDRRYLPMYAYDMVIMHICAGRLEEAKKYLEQMKNSHVCVTCETCACFEYHFAMGLVAELEGKAEDAKQYYKKAIEIKGDYPCAQRHLKKL